ncbi:tat pathway signal sequence protein [Rutstroemia sp. NJR-2017a BVV2]|nr:tat pathway signal sequence protein [Rutstroemia sp. NJR-2017a BVV2]
MSNFKAWKGQKYNALPSENAAKQRNRLFISHICLFIIYLLAFTVTATLNLQNEKDNNMVAYEDDLKKIDRTSVKLRGQEGYLAGLDVMHELHYHCIDHIRQILQCHSDISVHTFEWDPVLPYPVMKPVIERECKKWEPIYEWAKYRSPSLENGSYLEHPVLGELSFLSGA